VGHVAGMDKNINAYNFFLGGGGAEGEGPRGIWTARRVLRPDDKILLVYPGRGERQGEM
jgi:hypothetical protein